MRLRSLQNKLALLFLAITALAFAAAIFVVLPRLTSELQQEQLVDLEQVARQSSPAVEAIVGENVTDKEKDELIRAVGDSTRARVTLLAIQRSTTQEPLPYVISDSNVRREVKPDYSLARRAARANEPDQIYTHRGREGRVAIPIFFEGEPVWVLLYTRSFVDVDDSVALVRNRMFVAAGVALLVALIGGFLVARVLARRVGRLEYAAREVAAGRTVAPVPVESRDELGELTRTFNEMQRQLARVDSARKEFIANASHELRTPIFSLAGFVELLEDEQLDDATRRHFLETMREQVERLQKLAVDLLDLSRLDAGSLQLSPEEVDLGELARDVALEFGPAVDRHRTELGIELPEESVAAFCDRERTVQILRILLDNALRHTPEGTAVTVRIGGGDGDAELAVIDSGPGIDPAARPQLFERFFTADAARGSGLGLAIACELAERMDGRIELDSEPGRTVFRLALPAAESTREPEPTALI
ncbi:MAG TPA: ATP-binding protein [Thermoleophilaceae bacterium]|jgi:signal transduction histidine kinase